MRDPTKTSGQISLDSSSLIIWMISDFIERHNIDSAVIGFISRAVAELSHADEAWNGAEISMM
jgi:hypothetical protein